MNTTAIAYYRVSTERQGRSGLGLEAQRAAVEAFCRSRGLTIIDEVSEAVSGTRGHRTGIDAAIARAQETDSRLVVAKLDRLTREETLLGRLRESRVRFTVADAPDSNELTIDILAAVARDEVRRIRERTRAALAAKKARGEKLGTPANLTDAGRRAGSDLQRTRAAEEYRPVAGYIGLLRDRGESLRAIAARLTAEGHRTRTGRPFSAETVRRVLARAQEGCDAC